MLEREGRQVKLKAVSVIVLMLFLASMLTVSFNITSVKAIETTIFDDGFESYAVGTFPSSGGWELVWNGQGNNFQIVVDSKSFSGTKSSQLWGSPGWSAVAQKKFSTTSQKIGYEFAILIDSIGSGGPGRIEHPGFFNREAYVWGRYYATVNFNHDDLKIYDDALGEVLGTWEPGTWYYVKVVLDRGVNKYDVWINGEMKGVQLDTHHSDTHLINALALVSDHAGVKVYYDDVKVFFEGAPPPSYTLTINSSPTGVTFTINGTQKITPYTELLPEGSYTLIMPETHNGYVWSHWLEDGDPNRIKTILLQGTTWTAIYEPAPEPVGGKATPINIPMNKPETPALWIWLTTIMLSLVLTVVYVKKRKRHTEINS